MILAADIGNSNIVLGLIENGAIRNIIRIHTDLRYTSAEYGIQLRQLLEYYNVKPDRIEGAILSSAVPPITGTVADAIRTIIGQDCLTVGPGIKTGMNVRIEDPGSLAGDLVIGSVAAIACYGTPAIVLDLGTATTMVAIDEKDCYRGGAIIPGVRLGLEALSKGTSLLPEISVTAPKKVIATNTVDAMRSGAVYATAAMIDGMIRRMEAELGKECRIIATGSLASVIVPFCEREIICDENLRMKGLWLIWDKNHK